MSVWVTGDIHGNCKRNMKRHYLSKQVEGGKII